MGTMEQEVGRIEGILESVVEAQRVIRAESRENFAQLFRLMNKIDSQGCAKSAMHDDVEQRVRSLESDRAKAAGWVAAIGGAMGIAGGWVAKLVFGIGDK